MNAGRQQSYDSILEMPDEEFDWIMKTNLYAPYYIIKALLPHLKPGATIIATTSEQAYDPSAELYAYAQTKAATMNYVKSLAKQLGPKGIRVNGVAPGPVYTPLQISGWAAPGSRRSWRPSTCSWRRRMRPSPLATSTARAAAAASRRLLALPPGFRAKNRSALDLAVVPPPLRGPWGKLISLLFSA